MIGKLLAFFLYLALAFLPADKYYVTFVKGSVLLEKTKKPLKVGDVLNPEDKLVFADKTAKVACISPGKGRFDISPQASKAGSKGELFAVLKSSLVASSGTYHLSTRSLMFEGYDPVTYFASIETQGRILLIKDEPLSVKSSYKLDSGNFFFIQYSANGKTITHKIGQSEKGIIFTDKLFSSEPGVLLDKVNLCYQTNANGTARSSVIAGFIPVLASKEEITEQVKLMTEVIGSSDKKKLKAELSNHLFENYGKIGREELNRLFGIM
ncbi:MAG: hypothetical protein H7Y07_08740 [Pyrinomonadaceae bacterium]|nr:hypothetical protein [Sphingobacteriaceae bacterium]